MFRKRLNHRFGTVSYPTDKAFGVWAWTCMTLERAKERQEPIRFARSTGISILGVNEEYKSF